MIQIRQRIVPGSCTHTGSLWEASTEIDGQPYSATSRNGAPQALARMLAAAGIADQPVEVRSEAGVFDNGVEIRTEELRGCISYRSLDAMAKTTFEEGDRPLHRTVQGAPTNRVPFAAGRPRNAFHAPRRPSFDERSESLGAGGTTGQKCVSPAAADDLEAPSAEGIKTDAPTPAAETRRCDECDRVFPPARPWSRFCSPACRLRAHRMVARDTKAQSFRGDLS
jgi:hypothetical protein